MYFRYNVSDRAAAALATAILEDYGIITATNKAEVVDKCKIRREKARVGTLNLAERDADVQNLTCIGFDSKKDQKVFIVIVGFSVTNMDSVRTISLLFSRLV